MNQPLTKNQILTLAEIYQKYPHQWVLIVEPELDENLEIIKGEVIAKSPDRDGLYNKLHLRQGKPCAIEYTGSDEFCIFVPFLM